MDKDSELMRVRKKMTSKWREYFDNFLNFKVNRKAEQSTYGWMECQVWLGKSSILLVRKKL